jgi:hypothetical protein
MAADRGPANRRILYNRASADPDGRPPAARTGAPRAGPGLPQARGINGIQDQLRLRPDPIYLHPISPDLPNPVLHDPDPMRIVRRSGGTVTPDGGPLTTAAYYRARQWRQWLARPEAAMDGRAKAFTSCSRRLPS